jgi:hypothetical protein
MFAHLLCCFTALLSCFPHASVLRYLTHLASMFAHRSLCCFTALLSCFPHASVLCCLTHCDSMFAHRLLCCVASLLCCLVLHMLSFLASSHIGCQCLHVGCCVALLLRFLSMTCFPPSLSCFLASLLYKQRMCAFLVRMRRQPIRASPYKRAVTITATPWSLTTMCTTL